MANLLENIDYPSDLKKIKEKDLPKVCAELRKLIIQEASCNPGHFGASMGVIELTVALHYVYNTPYDKLIWGCRTPGIRTQNPNRKKKTISDQQNLQRAKWISKHV